MKTLHKFILKSFIGPFLLIFVVVVFLLLMQFLWKYIDDLVGKGLEWYIIAELMTYASAGLVPLALPLSVLMASLMTFGNMGEHYELTALKASGISLRRIMYPMFIVSIIISMVAFMFTNNVLPYSNLKMRALLWDVKRQRPELQIKEGIFYNGIENYSIKISHKDRRTNLLKDIMIYDHSGNKGNKKVIVADSGYMKMTSNEDYLMVTLYNGYSYTDIVPEKKDRDDSYPFRRDLFDKQTFFIELTGFGLERTDENLFKNHYQMKNLSQLMDDKDSLMNTFDRRKDNFHKSLITSSYFRGERRKSKEKPDSISYYAGIHKTIDIDSLYDSLSQANKMRTVEQAMVYARNANSYINSAYDEIMSRRRIIAKHDIEWHKKLTLSFACLILFFIGAPLGAIIRKGGLGMPVVVSVLFFLLYYIVSITGEKFARENVWETVAGMWLSTAIVLPMGIFLTYKATKDSAILRLESYTNFFKKLKIFNKNSGA